ncbi:MAG TPA: hypothetical protein V6C98_05990, partial [Thermosynechococcaceae cyanobacterium]
MRDEGVEEPTLAGVGEAGEEKEAGEAVMNVGSAEVETLTTSPRQRKQHTTILTPDLRSPLLPPMEEFWQLTLTWQPEADQQAQFQQLYALTLAGNRQFNLTR